VFYTILCFNLCSALFLKDELRYQVMDRKVMFPRPLQYLFAISEHGSYTRAAKAMHVSQPSLSQQIKQLEESLGSILLVRNGREVRLTDAGQTYLQHARQAYVQMDLGTRAIQDVQNLSRGSIRIGLTPITDFLTCQLLKNFVLKHSGITLSTLEMPANEIATAVSEDQIDVGIAFGPLSESEPKPEIKVKTLFTESLCFAVGREHSRFLQKERLGSQEFAKESLVLLNSDFALRRSVNSFCEQQNIVPKVVVETDSLSVIIEMVLNSPYGTVLPKGVIQMKRDINSIVLAPAFVPQAVTLITRDYGYNSPAAMAFADSTNEWADSRYESKLK
tara:strand:+ start:1179 stop:2177 length:999 start_codon:yes stop_codon:yes gene_type:complete